MVIHVNNVVAPSIALFRCFMYVLSNDKGKHDKYCTFTLFFNKWYCMHCLYNVVIVVVENKFQFNSICHSKSSRNYLNKTRQLPHDVGG